MGLWDCVLFIVATVVAAGVVKDAKVSNLWMLVVVPLVWAAFYVAFALLKMVWLMLPLILIGIGAWVLVRAAARKLLD